MSLRIPGVFSSRSSSFHLQCSHNFQQVSLGPKTFQVGFLQTAYFHILHSFFQTFLQIGSVLQYSLISFLAIPLVGASFISIGAPFQSFPVSLANLSTSFVFPPSAIISHKANLVFLAGYSPPLWFFLFKFIVYSSSELAF